MPRPMTTPTGRRATAVEPAAEAAAEEGEDVEDDLSLGGREKVIRRLYQVVTKR